MSNLQKFLILLVILVSGLSCKREEESGTVKGIKVDYRVEYTDKTAGSIPTRILPDQMKLIIGEDYAMNSIEGFLGQFSLIYIANLKKEKVTTLLKIFDKKYFYTGSKGELPCGIDRMDGMKLEKSGKQGNIAGYTVDEYLLSLPGDKNMTVYATSELDSRRPNSTTPYREIGDVLLQFYTRLSVLDMILVAESVEELEFSRDIFQVPAGYREISRIQMEKTISELFR